MILSALKNLDFDINFEAAAFCFLALLSFYLQKRYASPKFVNKTFRRLVLWQLAAIFLDIAGAAFISYAGVVPLWLNVLVNTLYFASMGALYYTTHLFFISFGIKKRLGVALLAAARGLLLLFYILLAANVPTGIFFSFKNGRYEHGPLYFLCMALPLAFFAECAMNFFIIKKRVSKSILFALAALLVSFAAAPALQYFFFPNVLIANFLSLFAIILCLFALVSPDYAELAKKREELFELQLHLEETAARESEKIHKRDKQREVLSGQIIDALAATIDAGDPNRKGHSEHVAEMSRLIARQMLLLKTEVQKVYYTAILHDIGIIGVPEEVAAKRGKLTDEEFKQIKKHSEIGERILSKITEMPEMAACVRSHHERFDGKGYPDGLKGSEIPLGARIIAVADAFDAMTHERSYKAMMTKSEAKAELRRMAGSQFDPEVVVAALEVLPDD